MKKLILLSLSVFTLVVNCPAQEAKTMEVHGMPVEVYARTLTDQLNKQIKLSPAQTAKMMEVNTNIGIKWSKAEHADRQAAKQAEIDINKYKMDEYKKILTKEQYDKWAHAGADVTAG